MTSSRYQAACELTLAVDQFRVLREAGRDTEEDRMRVVQAHQELRSWDRRKRGS